MTNHSPAVLGKEPVGKLLLQYSIPAIVGMTVTSLYNIIDSIFIGKGIGPLGITGLAVTFPLMNLVIAFCTLVAVGGATISSIYLGQKNSERATDVLHNVVLLCLINAVCFGSITFFFLDPILSFFGASEDTLPYARDFMQVLLAGTPVAYVFIGLNNIMRATGYPTKAMLSSLVTVGANILIAPVFIFGFKWGMRGAALATLLSQTCGLIWVLLHFYNPKSFIHFEKGRYKLRKRIILSIFSIGMSPFLMNVCACVVVIILNNSLRTYGGDMAIGAFGIINRMVTLFAMVVMGLAQGMQPIVGYNYGARMLERVRLTLKYGIIAGMAVTTTGFLLSELFPETLVALFTDNEELAGIAHGGLRICTLAFSFVGCQIIITNFFQSIGKSQVSIFLSLSRQLLFLLPCLLILPRYLGTEGVWWSLPTSDFIAFVTAVLTLMLHFKRINRTEFIRY
ncbi:MAG: MATE family efflux transporter [Coprobacter sp.]|nr:MATE family efflux transporter [Coprobacter sp.]